jgi:hypothetical protein
MTRYAGGVNRRGQEGYGGGQRGAKGKSAAHNRHAGAGACRGMQGMMGWILHYRIYQRCVYYTVYHETKAGAMNINGKPILIK